MQVFRFVRSAVGKPNMLASAAAIYFPQYIRARCTFAENVDTREVS
ncbi:MAG: hypothetical protein MIO93_01640 [ANME-2 cluster archaeon]|nr:hypothetical protein [ANME-2 cluster archaeon]